MGPHHLQRGSYWSSLVVTNPNQFPFANPPVSPTASVNGPSLQGENTKLLAFVFCCLERLWSHELQKATTAPEASQPHLQVLHHNANRPSRAFAGHRPWYLSPCRAVCAVKRFSNIELRMSNDTGEYWCMPLILGIPEPKKYKSHLNRTRKPNRPWMWLNKAHRAIDMIEQQSSARLQITISHTTGTLAPGSQGQSAAQIFLMRSSHHDSIVGNPGFRIEMVKTPAGGSSQLQPNLGVSRNHFHTNKKKTAFVCTKGHPVQGHSLSKHLNRTSQEQCSNQPTFPVANNTQWCSDAEMHC